MRVTEKWLGDAPNVHARGRARMSQEVNGVQTWHEYEACSLHGSLYTHSQETRVNGEAILPTFFTKILTNGKIERKHRLLRDGYPMMPSHKNTFNA